MHFFKKIFGSKKSAQEQDARHEHKDETHTPSADKETHDKEHNGENKKPKNVCEFC